MKNRLKPSLVAHLFAVLTILVWGSTFIASKLLLTAYSPLQIMLMRFLLAYIILLIFRPKILLLSLKEELYFALLGILGCTLYFLMENYALTRTFTANVSLLVATAPILTAVLAHFLLADEKLNRNVFYGFIIAIFGVSLVVFNGSVILKLSPIGDLLSLGAAVCWALYSVLLKRIITKYDSVFLTRRVMLWGLVTSLPLAFWEHAPFSLASLANPTLLVAILFLGVMGSGVCYVLWNLATRRLGIVKINNYIYLIPFVTMISGALILPEETISWMGVAGAVLITFGVILADRTRRN